MNDHRIDNDIINLQYHLSGSMVRRGINLIERHGHSGKRCELYFVPRVEPSSISPTTFTKSGLYGDFLYVCNVCWLSRGEMQRKVYILREEMAIFLEKTQMLPNFPIKNGFLIWHFLVDLTSHLDNLNLQLQRKLRLIPGLPDPSDQIKPSQETKKPNKAKQFY